MKKVMIHVGTPKTGSSFLQRKLQANTISLSRNNINYLTDGAPNNRALTLALKDARTESEIGTIFSDWMSRSSDGQEVLLSDEVFSTCKSEIISAICSDPHNMFKVCIYIRSPASYAESAYKQWFYKNAKYNNFKSFLDSWSHPNWIKNLNVWQQSGADVHIYQYRPRDFAVLDQFCDFVGLHVHEVLGNSISSDDLWGANPSLNSVGMKISKKLQAITSSENHEIQMLLLKHARNSCFSDMPSVFSLFKNKDEVQAYNFQYKRNLECIEQDFGVSLVADLFEYDMESVFKSDESLEEIVLYEILASFFGFKQAA